MQRNELVELLRRAKKGAVLHALVHRHKEWKGTINEGEQEYEKFVSGGVTFVKQTNALTGESYSHPDVEWLFQSDNWAEASQSADGEIHRSTHGLAWTINKACADTYYIKMVSCPARACAVTLTGGEAEESADAKAERLLFTKQQVVQSIVGEPVSYTAVAPTTFQQMKLHSAGKARTADQFKDHLSAVKRAMRKNNEDKHDATQTALASFMHNFDADCSATMRSFTASHNKVVEFKQVLAGQAPIGFYGALDKCLAVAAVVVGARSKDPEKAALDYLRFTREMVSIGVKA